MSYSVELYYCQRSPYFKPDAEFGSRLCAEIRGSEDPYVIALRMAKTEGMFQEFF